MTTAKQPQKQAENWVLEFNVCRILDPSSCILGKPIEGFPSQQAAKDRLEAVKPYWQDHGYRISWSRVYKKS